MSAGERSGDRDAAALAELGLDFGALDACVDVSLLWRAVRDLVLPGKVSEPTQQRILRRVWAVDPDIRPGSFVDWAAN